MNRHWNYQLLSASSDDGIWGINTIKGGGFILPREEPPIGGDLEGKK